MTSALVQKVRLVWGSLTLRPAGFDNNRVSVDKFLEFWSHHNQTIIQSLIVVTLIFIIALVFVTLFGSKEETTSTSVGVSPELEKSLQKLLDSQTKAAVFDFSKNPNVAAPSTAASGEAAAQVAEATAQVEKLKTEVTQKEKVIQELNAQLTQAASAKSQAGGDSLVLEAKIKELEARLAEYDIISEDIADLSRYKEENEKLKAQLAGASSAGAPSKPALAAVPPTPEAAPAATPAPPPAPRGPVDDDLMKEFTAAVEGQKAAGSGAPAQEAPPVNKENEDLMGQFENFVQKKEGS